MDWNKLSAKLGKQFEILNQQIEAFICHSNGLGIHRCETCDAWDLYDNSVNGEGYKHVVGSSGLLDCSECNVHTCVKCSEIPFLLKNKSVSNWNITSSPKYDRTLCPECYYESLE